MKHVRAMHASSFPTLYFTTTHGRSHLRPRMNDEKSQSVSSLDDLFMNACWKVTELFIANTRFYSKHKPSSPCGRRRNGIRAQQLYTGHMRCLHMPPSVLFAWKKVASSDFSDRSDRFYFRVRQRVASGELRRFKFLDLILSQDFPSGT